jgi:acetyltransferase-like isoleucine patch superfamily enzyme
MIKNFILILTILLPNAIKIAIYRKLFSWSIGKNVKVGISFISAQSVELDDGVKIGHFNIIKNLRCLKMGNDSSILNFNHFNHGKKEWINSFECGEKCSITSHHYFDCSGGIAIGDDIIFAGKSSQLWTHELNFNTHKLIIKSIDIGSNIYFGSSVLISPGSRIPSHCIIALGSVIPSKLSCDEWSLIAGNPAIFKKTLKNIE